MSSQISSTLVPPAAGVGPGGSVNLFKTRANIAPRSWLGPLTALGVVFGDIGTSPLYAVNQLFFHTRSVTTPAEVIGATSLVVWLLTIVIFAKYITVVLRADNAGEGGVFALLALVRQHKVLSILLLSGVLVFAAGMLLGDGVITPAISVLSAVEGLGVATPTLARFSVPITLLVLGALFAFQSGGTAKVGKLFGPVMLVWFVFLTVLGARSVVNDPAILQALNPLEAIDFLDRLHLWQLSLVLGSVILVVTGGEALFADLGHFGKRPIRLAWGWIVFPALVLDYLGQGGYVLGGHAVSGDNLFFSMVPHTLIYPSVVLATLATVIASQALISGAFSLVSQGIALGFIPPLRVIHTHDHHAGQTYLPLVNWMLFGGAALLVVAFHSSGHLASAYGLAVAADMLMTTIALSALARRTWRWPVAGVAAAFLPFGIIDGSLFVGNLAKIPNGGYVPLTIGTVLATVMFTWKWGRRCVRRAFAHQSSMTMGEILALKQSQSATLPKSMIFLTPDAPRRITDPVPPLLDLFYGRYEALPKHVILLRIRQRKSPYVSPSERYEVDEFENDHMLDRSLLAITASFGFREQPDLQQVIADIAANEQLTPHDDLSDWIIHAGKERLICGTARVPWQRARYGLFKTLAHLAEPSYGYFGLDEDARLTVEFVPVVL